MAPPTGRERWERICSNLTFANEEVEAWPSEAAVDARPGLGGRVAVCRFSWGNNNVTVSVGEPRELEGLVNGPSDAAALAAPGNVTFKPSDRDNGTVIDLLGWGRGEKLALKVYVSGDTVEPSKVAAVFDAALEEEWGP